VNLAETIEPVGFSQNDRSFTTIGDHTSAFSSGRTRKSRSMRTAASGSIRHGRDAGEAAFAEFVVAGELQAVCAGLERRREL